MRLYANPFRSERRVAGLLMLTLVFMAGCGKQELDYGFVIEDVAIKRGYQSLNVRLRQDLALSEQAVEALHHGVSLTISLEFELRNDANMIVVRKDERRFHILYRPLSQRFQLTRGGSDRSEVFSRLRHVLAEIDDLQMQFATGPLPPGSYELRARIRLDESRLPAPMQLPALFSSQWKHDSEWSVWPFKISA